MKYILSYNDLIWKIVGWYNTALKSSIQLASHEQAKQVITTKIDKFVSFFIFFWMKDDWIELFIRYLKWHITDYVQQTFEFLLPYIM